jgi:hypothetical protein
MREALKENKPRGLMDHCSNVLVIFGRWHHSSDESAELRIRVSPREGRTFANPQRRRGREMSRSFYPGLLVI